MCFVLRGVFDCCYDGGWLARVEAAGAGKTHAAMMAEKRARVTLMRGLAFLHALATSEPMCSPSLSQSVQIMTSCARAASFRRFLSTVCMS